MTTPRRGAADWAAPPEAYVAQLCVYYPAGDLARLKKRLGALRKRWNLPDQSRVIEKAIDDAYDQSPPRS